MRLLNLLLAAIFILFAFLQVDDPDSILWILVYGLMAVQCVLAAFSFYLRKAMIVLGIVYLGLSFIYFPGVMEWLQQENKSALFDNLAKMEHLYIEESREFLGLMICLVVLIFHFYLSRRRTA